MRTTLSIDDDVLAAVKDRARHENRTAGEVLSDLARQALNGGATSTTEFFVPDDGLGIPALPRRDGILVTNELIDRLREDGPY